MLPCYLSQELAIKILRIGKSINFIKVCLEKLPRTNSSSNSSSNSSNSSSNSSNSSSNSSNSSSNSNNVKAIRKSYRSINKSKRLGINAQIIIDDNDDVNMNDNNDNNGDDKNVTSNNNDYHIITSKRVLTMSDLLGTIITNEVQHTIESLSFGDESILHSIIYSLSHSIDKRLLHLMMSRFYVQQHLLALKKFMLLGDMMYICILLCTYDVMMCLRMCMHVCMY